MKVFLFIICLVVATPGQSPRIKPAAKREQPSVEMVQLREEFKKATLEYKSNLQKLLAIYERNVIHWVARRRLAQPD